MDNDYNDLLMVCKSFFIGMWLQLVREIAVVIFRKVSDNHPHVNLRDLSKW